GLLGVVLTAQKPDLARPLLPHHARQIAGAEAGVERSHARARLAEARVQGGDREVAEHVQHVPAADRQAVDGRDHRLGDLADRAVQRLDLEQPAARGPVVAAGRALLLVASRAEGALARPRQRHHADVGRRPGSLEAVDQLVDGVRRERVQPRRAVDHDPAQALLYLVAHVCQLLHVDPPPCAIVLVKAITAALAPAYTASWAEPTRAASELRLTIRPQPRCAIAPMTACVVRRQPS